MAHEKPLRGRKLTVTFAHQAPLDQYNGSGGFSSSKNRKTMMDTGRPTTLSMLKTGLTSRHEGWVSLPLLSICYHEHIYHDSFYRKTRDKIAMMEAKLRQMESTNPKPANPDIALLDMDTDLEGISLPEAPPPAPSSILPQHPSLPMKPPPTIPDFLRPNQPTQSRSQPSLREKSLLPPLPLLMSTPSHREKTRDVLAQPSGQPVRSGKPTKFIGIKVVKTKPKEKEKEKEEWFYVCHNNTYSKYQLCIWRAPKYDNDKFTSAGIFQSLAGLAKHHRANLVKAWSIGWFLVSGTFNISTVLSYCRILRRSCSTRVFITYLPLFLTTYCWAL